MRHVTGLDHVVVAVEDLDAGEAALRRLGFTLTPRGHHAAPMNTSNSTAVFRDNSYVELMGVRTPSEANAPIREAVGEGRSIAGLAFKTDRAEAAARELAEAGLGEGDLAGLSRPVDLYGETREASFRLAHMTPGALPGARAFICEHRTPDLVWREDSLDHENGVAAIVEIAGAASDLAGLARALSPFGGRVRRDDDSVRLVFGETSLAFHSPEALRARFGTAPSLDPALHAILFRVADLEATRELLNAHGVVSQIPDSQRLVVAPEHPQGLVFEFVER
jgi:catechol 2,3-dioxygenase-like lactoylglutathione lyase family enzyme